MQTRYATCADPDQTQQIENAASYQGLHCLLTEYLMKNLNENKNIPHMRLLNGLKRINCFKMNYNFLLCVTSLAMTGVDA